MKPTIPFNEDNMFDLDTSCSVTEYTGLIPFAPENHYSISSYNHIMDYLPSDFAVKDDKPVMNDRDVPDM